MTTIYTSPRAASDPEAPGTHVFIVGVGEYLALVGGDPKRLLEDPMGLRQLSSPPISAAALANWFMAREGPSPANTGFYNDRAPLATMEMLLSPSQSYTRPDGAQVPVEPATRTNIALAFECWKEHIAGHSDNIGVFYFCGHGVMGHNDYLLPSDFGLVNRGNPWVDAIDITNTARAMRRLISGSLYFFIDACRQAARQALDPGASAGSLEPVNFGKPVRSFTRLMLWATGEGEAAFGAREKVSRFTEALIEALSGYEGEAAPDGKGWVVTGSLLARAVSAILERANTRLKPERRQRIEEQLIGSQPFHFETERPQRIAVGIPSSPFSWSVDREIRPLLAAYGLGDKLRPSGLDLIAEQLESKNLQVQALQQEIEGLKQRYTDLEAEVHAGSKLAQHALQLLSAGRWNEAKAAFAELKFGDLSECGWGVIFARDADPSVREALRPLLELRRQQATRKHSDRYREFAGSSGYRAGDTVWDFLARQQVSVPGSDWSQVPYYLLIVGDPNAIPFTFEYQLSKTYGVGRLHFSDSEQYTLYAKSVLKAETEQIALPRALTIFAPEHSETEPATKHTMRSFVTPLVRWLIGRRSDWEIRTQLRSAATKVMLGRLLGGEETPALLFVTAHGCGFPSGYPHQLDRQGALICADWAGRGKLAEEHMFAAADVATDAHLLGSIALLIGPFTAGTPAFSDPVSISNYKRELKFDPLAPKPFLSRLPQRLLSHPAGGALAVVGHLGLTWSEPWAGAKGNQDVEMFFQVLMRLMRGHPIGAAMRPLFQRYAECAERMADEFESWLAGQSDAGRFSMLLRAFHDLRGYLILGDPAVRLKIMASPGDRGAEASAKLASKTHEGQRFETLRMGVSADLSKVGWGVVFPAGADDSVREALRELLDHRRKQASSDLGSLYREFHADNGYQRGETAERFLARQTSDLQGTSSRLPHFLLIVGDPVAIPYEFQLELADSHSVGRLYFEDFQGYRHYARSVLDAELGRIRLPRQVAFFSPQYQSDPLSDVSVNRIILPLAEELERQAAGWRVRTLIGERATKLQMKKLLGGSEVPAFLFVVTRSVGGMLVCHYPASDVWKFTGESSVNWVKNLRGDPPLYCYSAEDVSVADKLTGLIVLLYTSFGVGEKSRLALLPQALLGNQGGGALAIVGVAGDLLFFNATDPFTRVGRRLEAQHEFLKRITKGERLGSAMDALRLDYTISEPWLLIGDPAVCLSV